MPAAFVPVHPVTGIEEFLRAEIDVGSFPGAVYAVGSPARIEASGAVGNAVAVPLRIPATLDTIYDCASLTKPLITTTLVLQAVAEGRIRLDDEFRGFPYRRLLTHTSGLTAWLPLYTYGNPVAAVLEHGREYEPGTKVVYSDLNFILLYHALGPDYVEQAAARIFRKLGLPDAMFRPAAQLKPRIAATEWSQRWEMEMCAERKVSWTGFRQGLIWGETHDGNSHHLGGTAGNAGLFAAVRAVYRIAQGWLDGTLVPRELLAEATRNHTAGLEENRGLGWQLAQKGHAATGMLSERAFGHTGFTGTSLWIDGDRVMVLLTNRVHPCAAPNRMQRIRGEFHRLAQA